MRRLAVLLAACFALAFAPVPLPKPKKPARPLVEQLQGSWERLVYTRAGTPVTLIKPDGGPIHLVVEGSVFTYTQGPITHGVWDAEVDEKSKPATFRTTWRKSKTTHKGTMVLEGDKLTLRYSYGDGAPEICRSGYEKGSGEFFRPGAGGRTFLSSSYCRYCWMRVVRRPARPCWSMEYCQDRNSSTVRV